MKLSITQDLEPLPKRSLKLEFETTKGLLNSCYKDVVKCNFSNHKTTSIFGIKRRIKNRQFHFTSRIETLLKVSVFVIALAVIF